jgi:peptide deformylase
MTPLLPDNHPMLARTMPVFDFSPSDAKQRAAALVDALVEAMHHHRGIGLAANQIGIEARAFAIQISSGESLVMFNPLVTWMSTDTAKLTEGCLSFTGLELSITRPRDIQIAYDDEEGVRRVLDLTGIDARCALHECDHLDGVVFTSKVSKLRLAMARKKMQKKA